MGKNRASERRTYYSVPQAAVLLGISRIAVFKKVKSGEIKAIRIGRSYGIPASSMRHVSGKSLTPERTGSIKREV